MTLRTTTGLAVSGASPRGLELLELAEHQFRCFIGDPVATVNTALEDSPDMVMGHVLLAYLMLLGTEPAGLPVAAAAWRSAEALPADEREARHVRAVGLLVDGRLRAAARVLEDLTIDHPLDTLALQAGHQTDFLLGDSRMLRDRIARALPAWHTDMPAWHAVAGMLAFGLEETGDYARAERYGRRAVERQPRDGWAQHAVAHVMEMQNRRHDGIEWMRAAPKAWAQDSFLSVHNHWHLALFHLGLDDIDAVLALYDGPVCADAPGLVFDLVDQSALLWRLHLRGVDVGSRWQALADRWAPIATTGRYAFNDMHATMAFAAAGRTDLIRAVADAQQALIADKGSARCRCRVALAGAGRPLGTDRHHWPLRLQRHACDDGLCGGRPHRPDPGGRRCAAGAHRGQG
ncbi:hypothetical protein BSY238_646 [Methyloversatilis sp. RAC08]|uniref:tetratricopeptide repeat protein n=1 Tax=Methyloversatilis sp. RAC08 TaxID=1842540 RepID=UPI0008560960|nr:tetratricopeptide repeat protein [Methyloversatilis sp. RAC08]AOF82409.1 hypothetical protein BSY238_646 [Methyloversatilis sp. RAC08]